MLKEGVMKQGRQMAQGEKGTPIAQQLQGSK